MAQEQEKEPVQLTHVGLDLTTGVVSLFGARNDELVRFRFFLPPGLQQLLTTQPPTERSLRTLLDAGAASDAPLAAEPVAAAERSDKSPTLVLPGKLQTKPQDGRPDRQGKPTAWARFLARIEGRDGATLLSTSFHGRTREIALGLSAEDHITAQGYLHLRAATDAESRLSSFSVIHLLQYPGKPQRDESS
jgi:hypothetical protein